jgi:hypothetical protein
VRSVVHEIDHQGPVAVDTDRHDERRRRTRGNPSAR